MYFTLSQMQYFIISIFGGLLLVLILFLVYWSYRLGISRSRAETHPEDAETDEAGKEEFADGLKESHKPIPLILTILIAVVLIWGIIYVLAVAMGGLNVQ